MMQLLFSLVFIFFIDILNTDAAKIKKNYQDSKQVQKIAIEAYIYGYSMITSEITRIQMTNVNKPELAKAPMGQFIIMRHYPLASFRGVTAPNADTLYSLAWLDLNDEPWIFSHPDMTDRFYLFPMSDLWMNIIDSPGTRTTGSAAATYMITGPKWNKTLPFELEQQITKHIHSPTRYLVILGRTYCLGTSEDYATVHQLQDQYLLRPLSIFAKTKNETSIPKINPNPGFSMTDKVRDVINNMNITTYFNMLTTLMKDSPPLNNDHSIVKKMAKIGLFPGEKFNYIKFNGKIRRALNLVPKLAFNKIKLFESKSGTVQNGWIIANTAGDYGIDYIRRAFIAAYGWPGNLPKDAVYAFTTVDSTGKKLSGTKNYTIHFAKDQTPPVKAFWSITMYDSEYFFVSNSLNKFTLSPRDPLIFNVDDGSLDLYFQHNAPEENKRANWLPSPQGTFILMLRMYWPQIHNTSWTIPPVKKLD